MSRDDKALDDMRFVENTGSTNDDVKLLAQQGAPAGFSVVAKTQTSGRGRRGHVWESPRGGLYLSVLLRPTVPMSYFVGLSAVVTMAVLGVVRDELGLGQCCLKWPNDVLVDNKKLCGVLVEAGSSSKGPYAVCGVGVNVERPQAHLDVGVTPMGLVPCYLSDYLRGYAAEEGERSFKTLARGLRDAIMERTLSWEEAVLEGKARKGPLEPILTDYMSAIPLLGRHVSVFDPADAPLEGAVFAGVDEWGRAHLLLDSGEDVVYASEQVSLRLAR